jgi:Fe-S-cluster containining protein
MTPLYQIQREIQLRTAETAAAHPDWPCRKGCDDCCRSLASVPRIAAAEWLPIARAIVALPPATAAEVRRRIRDSAGASRPVVCPLLDLASGACLVYDARPLACRAYGFYAERDAVLGCRRIETLSLESPNIVWGNHSALEARVHRLGAAAELSVWLDTLAPEVLQPQAPSAY